MNDEQKPESRNVGLSALLGALIRWRWSDEQQAWTLRVLWLGRNRATVWPNGVWHTWDSEGCGGENSHEREVWMAKVEAVKALRRQKWL